MKPDLDARRRQLDILAGTWDTTITPITADGTPGSSSGATDTYGWSASGLFLEHEVDAMMDRQRVPVDGGPRHRTRYRPLRNPQL